MGRVVAKCCICKKEAPKESRITIGGKNYCISCGQNKQKESEEYKRLVGMICYYYRIPAPSGYMVKQLKNFKEVNNYTYSGMEYTLWYCREILNKEFDIKYGLAIIGYEYHNAEQYFLQQCNIENSIKNYEEKVKIIKVKHFKKTKNNNFLINIEDLIGGDDN